MLHIATFIRSRLVGEENGVTAIEYALLATLIAIVIIVSVTLVGTSLDTLYDGVASSIAPTTP